jgi:hypothetical protein
MSLEQTQQTIDHYFDVMTRGGDFAVYLRSCQISGILSVVIRPLDPDIDGAAAKGSFLMGTATERLPSSCSPSLTAWPCFRI